jgi:hypothetical protein
MKLQLGAEPKKVAILVGLLLVAAVVFFMNSDPGVDTGSASAPAAAPVPSASQLPTPAPETAGPARTRGRTSAGQFSPSLRPKRGEQRPDPTTIDPTLRLDLLAKLQTVSVEGTRRSIFDFSQPPAPKPDPVKVASAKPVPNPIVPIKPVTPVEQANTPPPKPPAPPIPLKFYGYVNPAGVQAGPKRAFFMEGEDIFIGQEGELVKKRYRIVRIGVNSAVVEDTQFGSQQTLPLEEQQQG